MTTHDYPGETNTPDHVDPATASTSAGSEQADPPTTADTRHNRPIPVGSCKLTSSRLIEANAPAQTHRLLRPIQRFQQPRGRRISTTVRGAAPNHQPIPRFSPRQTLPNSGAGGTASKPASSTTPNAASNKQTAWCPTSSNSSAMASPRHVRDSSNNGVAARTPLPKIFGSPSNATENSSTDCSRFDAIDLGRFAASSHAGQNPSDPHTGRMGSVVIEAIAYGRDDTVRVPVALAFDTSKQLVNRCCNSRRYSVGRSRRPGQDAAFEGGDVGVEFTNQPVCIPCRHQIAVEDACDVCQLESRLHCAWSPSSRIWEQNSPKQLSGCGWIQRTG